MKSAWPTCFADPGNTPKMKTSVSVGMLFVLALSASAVSQEATSPWKGTRLINSGWQYLEKSQEEIPDFTDPKTRDVDLPHTWNALDTLDPKIKKDYRRDISWYRRRLELSEKERSGRLFLRFGAAGQVADVYVNGHHVGQHKGGYTAFTFEITNRLKKTGNVIAVRVSNAKDKMLAPLEGDFNQYGGIYRSVQLIAAPRVNLSRKHRGGPGVRV